MDESIRQVRYEIFQYWLDKCRPPTLEELAKMSGLSTSKTMQKLEKLDELHHIKLYREETPSITPIAMAHPFSHLDSLTLFPMFQSQGSKTWWPNCAWCAFGLAAMLLGDCSVNVLLRSSGNRCEFKIVDGKLQKPYEDFYITFSPPPSKWWDDVRFACTTIQVCESKEAAEAWFSQHGFVKGDILNVTTVWELSKAWYGRKHQYDYDRFSSDEAKALFQKLGMISPYWTT